jgi:Cys-rich peptide (Clo7bot family)
MKFIVKGKKVTAYCYCSDCSYCDRCDSVCSPRR